MATKVKVSGVEIMNLPISELTERSAQVLQELGPNTEAMVVKNKDTLAVLMSVERRNALAEAEEKLAGALLYIDMLSAGRSIADIERSASEARDRLGTPIGAYKARLRNQIEKPKGR